MTTNMIQQVDVERVTSLIMGETRTLVEAAFRADVKSDADLSTAVDVLREIKDRMKRVEKERTDMVKPINSAVQNINAKFKQVLEPLEDAERALKAKTLDYQRTKEAEARAKAEEERKRIQEEMLARAERIAAVGNVEKAVEVAEKAAVITVKPEETGRGGFTGAKSTIRLTWTFDLEDVTALAAARPDLVAPDAAKINQVIREGAREIPGLRIYQKESLSVR